MADLINPVTKEVLKEDPNYVLGGGGDGSGVSIVSGMAVVIYDSGWANRPEGEATMWIGPSSNPPPIGGPNGAVEGVDMWVQTS